MPFLFYWTIGLGVHWSLVHRLAGKEASLEHGVGGGGGRPLHPHQLLLLLKPQHGGVRGEGGVGGGGGGGGPGEGKEEQEA